MPSIPASPPKSEGELLIELKDEVDKEEKELRVRAETHLNRASFWETAHNWFGLPSSILTAIGAASAGVSALAQRTTLAWSLSLAVAILASLNAFLKSEDLSRRHLLTGREYAALASKLKLLSLDLRHAATRDQTESARRDAYSALRETYAGLLENKATVAARSPRPSPRTYDKVRKKQGLPEERF